MNTCALRNLAMLIIAMPALAQAAGNVEQLLIGTWLHKETVLGQVQTSLVTYYADGQLLEESVAYSQKSQTASSQVPSRITVLGERRGEWALQGSKLIHRYLATGSPDQQEESESRIILSLDERRFISANARFGIEVSRERINRQTIRAQVKE